MITLKRVVQILLAAALMTGGNALAFDTAHLKRLETNGSCENCDLSGADLRKVKMAGGDLSGSNLSGANLSGADLKETYISNANLSGTDLSGANLTNAFLFGSDLRGANLVSANLAGTNFVGADLSNAKLRDSKSGATIWFAELSNLDVLKPPGVICSNCGWTEKDGTPPRYCASPSLSGWHGFEACITGTSFWRRN